MGMVVVLVCIIIKYIIYGMRGNIGLDIFIVENAYDRVCTNTLFAYLISRGSACIHNAY